MANDTLLRAAGGPTYIFGRANQVGDRGFTAMGKRLDRLAKAGPKPLRRPLKGAAKTLKHSDLADVPVGIYNTIRRHPYRAVLAGTALIYLANRWRHRA